jgi:RNA polymerase sigma-70 factor (ECF subfamily)
LKEGDDREAWEVFYRTYGRMITGLATRAGLEPEEAEDALQDTIVAVRKNLPGFRLDPAAGSFKSWLLQMAKWRILNQLKKRPRGIVHRLPSRNAGGRSEATTATVDRVPSPEQALEAIWEDEWKERTLDLALERLKRQTSDRHFQIFYLNAVKGQTAAAVAKALGTHIGQVYLIRCRLMPKLKRLLRVTDEP